MDSAEECVGRTETRVDGQRFLGVGSRECVAFFEPEGLHMRIGECNSRDAHISRGEIRVEQGGSIQQIERRIYEVEAARVPDTEADRLKIERVRLLGSGRDGFDPALLFRGELRLERVGDIHRDVGLDGEDVREITFVNVRPEVLICRSVDELRGDSNSILSVTDAALHHRSDVELGRDLGNREIGILVAQYGRTGDHTEVLKLFYRSDALDTARTEAETTTLVYQKGLPVPRVSKVVEVDGRPGIVMERISGISMLTLLKKEALQSFFLFAHLG